MNKESVPPQERLAYHEAGQPGFRTLIADVPNKKEISHLLSYKRDRLGRPENPLSMMVIEQGITNAGVTIIFNDGIASPRASWGDRSQSRRADAIC